MNENVIIKTPKRRRWIARLLVSALCILLASSLLFVGVVAENIELVAQYSSNYGLATTPFRSYIYPFGSNLFIYSNSYMVYLQVGSTVKSVFDVRSSSGYDSTYNSTDFSFYYDGSSLFAFSVHGVNGALRASLYTFSIVDNEFVSASVENYSINNGATYYKEFCPFVVVNDNVYSFYFFTKSSSSSTWSVAFLEIEGSTLSRYDSTLGGVSVSAYPPSVSFQNGNCIVSFYKQPNCWLFNIYSDSFSKFNLPSYSTTGQNYFFDYEGDTFYVNSSILCKWDINTVSFERVGSGVPGYYFSAYNGVLTSYSLPASMSIPYTVYTGLPTTEPPPDSSDETTTEPPPESSEETSEPDVTMTKIWKYEPGSGGTSVSVAIGEVDLNNAVKLEAFLGRFESSPDNSDWTDAPQNLMLRVTNSDDTEDIYQFDFPAFGYYSGLLSSEVELSDFVFPGFVGYWFEIPFENGSEISFAAKSPGGSVFLYGYNMQLTVNFNSPDSSFRLLFGQDSYSVVLSNIGENSLIVVFEDETVLRYKKFTVNGSSSWYAPEEGTFALFPASDVLDPNILLSSIRIETNVDNTIGFPTESFLESVSKWEEYLSRQEDKQDFLNSLAGDAYDQISIDPDTSEAYGDAVDTFSTIVNSEGGSVIFGFFRYMWSVHPLMSSMASLVVTFAIVGFVVRKV